MFQGWLPKPCRFHGFPWMSWQAKLTFRRTFADVENVVPAFFKNVRQCPWRAMHHEPLIIRNLLLRRGVYSPSVACLGQLL
jgi:hypothetical protein